MNIDPTIYGYTFEADLICPGCLVENLIEQGRLAPAARDLGLEQALEQMASAEALSTIERMDSDTFPQAVGAYSGLTEEDSCGGCLEPLLG